MSGFDVFTQADEVRRHIGYMPENNPLHREMRVRDYLKFRARLKPMSGERLTILANGHGLGRMAADALLLKGGHLATLEKETVQQLAGCCRPKPALAIRWPCRWRSGLQDGLRRWLLSKRGSNELSRMAGLPTVLTLPGL